MEKQIKTPKYWADEDLQPLTEAETVYGHKVMIPTKFSNGWEYAKARWQAMTRKELDPLDGLEIHEEQDPIFYDLERVCYEIYEEDE